MNILSSKLTLEGVLGAFNKTIAQLEQLEQQEIAEIERRNTEIAQAQAALATATNIATIARNKRERFLAIFGDQPSDTEANINTLRAVQ